MVVTKSLPMRTLVAISQAEAALTSRVWLASPISYNPVVRVNPLSTMMGRSSGQPLPSRTMLDSTSGGIAVENQTIATGAASMSDLFQDQPRGPGPVGCLGLTFHPDQAGRDQTWPH